MFLRARPRSGRSLAMAGKRRSGFRFLSKVALADIAFVARGDSIGELFESAARALTEVMVDRRSLSGPVRRRVEVAAETADRLLYDFLTELILLKDVDSLLFKDFHAEIRKSKKGWGLACEMRGEGIDRSKHLLRNDVKAVTMHMFGVKGPNGRRGRWEATVVLDI